MHVLSQGSYSSRKEMLASRWIAAASSPLHSLLHRGGPQPCAKATPGILRHSPRLPGFLKHGGAVGRGDRSHHAGFQQRHSDLHRTLHVGTCSLHKPQRSGCNQLNTIQAGCCPHTLGLVAQAGSRLFLFAVCVVLQMGFTF